MTSYRNLLMIALLLLLAGGGLAIWNAEHKVAPPPETTQTEQTGSQGPEMVGQNVSFTVTEGETKKWKLDAVKAIYNENRTEATLSDVKGEFYDKAGKPVLQFTAPQGAYSNKNNAVVLKGGVIAKSSKENAGELHAPQMVWDAKTKQVLASGGIELIFGQGKSTAETCKFDLDFSNISLQGRVNSVITPP